eukprot:gnl/TRDRNA2_/TRDRNA2_176290_c6_seq1.p1 gnl/TRDRNA2_/TRDRNA2_176290_c6~~gnl/TRDRNA2_/TRDRNA2_176290_c6_seq1.p1  ORF type:complete len:472 (+),score=59.25 gnl/TRDRNA2_/TRDRNA2_176290_c6_seq1:152-1567(+)
MSAVLQDAAGDTGHSIAESDTTNHQSDDEASDSECAASRQKRTVHRRWRFDRLRRAASPPSWPTDADEFDKKARLWYWHSIVQDAFASEVVVNIFLPWILCRRISDTLQTPSDGILAAVVLSMNLASSMLEGFWKSARLLSQSLYRVKPGHRLIFLTSQSFCDGFLSVISSFPDIASCGSLISVGSGSLVLGVGYCVLNFIGSIVCYKIGRQLGWRGMQRWSFALECFCRIWPLLAKGAFFAAAVLLCMAPSMLGHALPLDLSRPGFDGFEDVRIAYDGYTVPPALIGLAVGASMSAGGALTSAVLSNALCVDHAKPVARLAANVGATALVILVQKASLPEDAVALSFIMMKLSTSFCGALSAFSGTIGDVTDSHFGAAPEANVLDSSIHPVSKAGSSLPVITAAQNLLVHWILTLAVMIMSYYAALSVEKPPPIILRLRGRPRHWAREISHQEWHAPHGDGRGSPTAMFE